jgi:hypothetical protein
MAYGIANPSDRTGPECSWRRRHGDRVGLLALAAGDRPVGGWHTGSRDRVRRDHGGRLWLSRVHEGRHHHPGPHRHRLRGGDRRGRLSRHDAARAPSAHGPPTTSDGKIDEDALATWEPPPMAAVMGKPVAPVRAETAEEGRRVGSTRLRLAGELPGQRRSVLRQGHAHRPSAPGRRVLAAIVTYRVRSPRTGRARPATQVACLCHDKTVLQGGDVEACEEPWRKARAIDDDKFVCRENDDDVSAVIYRRAG